MNHKIHFMKFSKLEKCLKKTITMATLSRKQSGIKQQESLKPHALWPSHYTSRNNASQGHKQKCWKKIYF